MISSNSAYSAIIFLPLNMRALLSPYRFGILYLPGELDLDFLSLCSVSLSLVVLSVLKPDSKAKSALI